METGMKRKNKPLQYYRHNQVSPLKKEILENIKQYTPYTPNERDIERMRLMKSVTWKPEKPGG
jgi:hypothetical protein